MGHLRCYCQTSIPPFPLYFPLMTNVFPVQKHMLLLKKLCCNSWVLPPCLWLLRGRGAGKKKHYLFRLRVFLTASLYVLSLKERESLTLTLLGHGFLFESLGMPAAGGMGIRVIRSIPRGERKLEPHLS